MNSPSKSSTYHTLIKLLRGSKSSEALAITNFLQDLVTIDPCGFQISAPRGYTAEQCYLVMVHAAMLNTSLNSAALDLLRLGLNVPKAEAILKRLDAQDLDRLVQNFDRLFHQQWKRLAQDTQRYLGKQLLISLDTVQHPYYGDLKKAQVVGGKKKASSKHHHTYGSAKLLWEGHGLTIGVRMLAKGDKWREWTQDLVNQANTYGVPLLILGDGGFWINELLWGWRQQQIGFIVRTGGGVASTAIVKELEQEAKLRGDIVVTSYTITLARPKRHLNVQLIAWADSTGETYSIGVPIEFSKLPPEWLVSLYRSRFAIETGHKLWNELKPRTTSHSPRIRYSLVATAVALYNSYVERRTGGNLSAAPHSRNWRRLIQLVRQIPPPSHPSESNPPSRRELTRQMVHASVVIQHFRSESVDLPNRISFDEPPKGYMTYQFNNLEDEVTIWMDSIRPKYDPPKPSKPPTSVHKTICTTGPLTKNFQPPPYFITIKGIISTWFRFIVTLSNWITKFYLIRPLFDNNIGLVSPT